MEVLKKLYAITDFCFSAPIDAPVCILYWKQLTKISLFFLFLILFRIAFIAVKRELEFRRNKAKVDHLKKIADPETMQKHTWKGLDVLDDEVGQKDLADQFRAAIGQNKIKDNET